MEIGIGLGQSDDPARAARDAVRQAKKAVKKPSLALVFGSIRLDQKKLHRALRAELDARVLIGGSSYAEISTAGVTKGSVVALLLRLDGAAVAFAGTPLKKKPFDTGAALARDLPAPAGLPVGLLFSAAASGYDHLTVEGLRSSRPEAPVFGGLTCGDYDLGLGHKDFWRSFQYGPELAEKAARLALLDFPAKGHRLAFAYEHGWEPVGPEVALTRCEGNVVYEVGGMPVFDYYRQFLGHGQSREFFELMIQRYGFAVTRGEAQGSALKLPVVCDFKKKSIMYVPGEDLQGKRVRMIQSSRKALIDGSRRAAQRCKKALGAMKPRLVVMVSCCTRSAILHSRMDDEVAAVREVFGYDVPIAGYYSGGEIVSNQYHATTVALMALGASA